MQLLLRILTLAGRIWLRLHGISPGHGGWVHGFPVVRLKPGSSVQIGNNVVLLSISRFNPLAPAGKVSLVTNTPSARISIHNGAGISSSVISCSREITIGEETLIGANCLIIDSDFHGFPLGENQPAKTAPVKIGRRVFIGARSIILKGVTIGDGAVIGAGSVVSRNIPPNSVAAGNPATVLRTLDQPTNPVR